MFLWNRKIYFLPITTFENRAPYNEIFFYIVHRYYLLRNLVKKIFLLLSWLTFVGKHSRFYREIFALLLCIYYLACSALCTTIPHYSKKGKNYTTIEFKSIRKGFEFSCLKNKQYCTKKIQIKPSVVNT